MSGQLASLEQPTPMGHRAIGVGRRAVEVGEARRSSPLGLGRWLVRLSVPVGALGVCVLFRLWDPNDGGPASCPFLALTGRHCPGCGSTRALHALTRGDIAAAASLNVLAMLALPALALHWANRAVPTGRRPCWLRRFDLGDPPPSFAAAAAVAVVAFAVARNLPWFPLSALAP